MLIWLSLALAAETSGRTRGVDYTITLPEGAVLGEAFEISDGPMTIEISAQPGITGDFGKHATLRNGHDVRKEEPLGEGIVVVHRKRTETEHYGVITPWISVGVGYYLPAEKREDATLFCHASSPARQQAVFDVSGWIEHAKVICGSLQRHDAPKKAPEL